MFDRRLRIPKDRLLRPLARAPFSRLHPNLYTLLAFAFGMASAVAAWRSCFILALVLWIANRILDGFDGTVARATGRQSDLGGYIDIVLDHVVYAAIPLGIALAEDTLAGYRALAVMLGSFYVNAASWMYLAALLEKREVGAAAAGELTTITMPSGLIEGAETVVFYTLFVLFPAHAAVLFLIMAGGVLFTAAQRLVWAVRVLR
jgi:phosphatidylglycerophosphate synthase